MDVDLGPLINLGGVGAVLAWFLFRAEKKFDDTRISLEHGHERMSRSLDRMVRAQMLAILALPGPNTTVKQQAQDILQEIKEDATNGK